MKRSRLAVTAAALLAVLGSFSLAAPAQAATSTTISFTSTAVTAAFGSNWVIGLKVAFASGGFTGDVLDTQDGTVDVTVDGVPGTYASGVPIYRGGQAFLSPPDSAPLLAAGAHVLHASFRPAAGSGLVSSTTAKPATLTITPLALDAKNVLINDATVVGSPVLRMSLSGAYVDALGTPAGSWAVKVQSAGANVLEKTVPQPAGSTIPVDVSLAEAAKPGRTLTFSGVFTPDPAVAGGITLTNPSPATFAVPSLSFVQVLATPVVLPWWLFILLLLLVLGLIAAAIVLLIRNARAAERERGPDPDEIPVDEPDVEPEPGLWQLSPTGIEPAVARDRGGRDGRPSSRRDAEGRLPAPRYRGSGSAPGTGGRTRTTEPETEKPAPRSWTLSSADDDDA